MALSRDEFMAQMARLNAVFEDKFTITPKKMDIFFERLSYMDPKFFVKAVNAMLDTGEFAPTIASIRTKYEELSSEWQEHSNKIHEIFDSVGNRWPDFPDGERAEAVEIWDRLVFGKNDDHAKHIKAANYLLKEAEKKIAEFEQGSGGMPGLKKWLEDFEKKMSERRKAKGQK